MDYQVLRDELDTDPNTRGYSGMTDVEAADDMNLEYESENRELMRATEVYNAIDSAEYNNLTVDEKQEVRDILSLGEVNPFGREASRFLAIFGAGSNTVTQLASDRTFPVSRGTKIGWGHVRAGDIGKARAL